MEQYLSELVKIERRVILPDLGALVIMREGDSTTILFNSFLSFNDGLLVNKVAQTEGISSDEATNKVALYIESIKKELTSKGEYELKGIGTLSQKETGSMIFTQDESSIIAQSTEKNSTIIDINIEKRSDDDDLLHIESSVPVNSMEMTTAPIVPTELSSELLNEPLIELQQTQVTPPTVAPKPEPQQQKVETKPQPKENEKEKKSEVLKEKSLLSSNMTTTKKNNSSKKIILWIILALLAIALIVFYYMYWKPTHTTPAVAPEVPAVIIDTTEVEPQVEEPIVEAPVAQPQAAFHIIVGSYKTTSQAAERVERLKNKGYSNATYFHRGNFYVVSIDALPNQIEADRVQEEILDKDRIESWIVTTK